MALVTCHTAECDNAGIPIELAVSFVDDEGQTHYVSTVFCGVCGNPITDIDPPLPNGEMTMDENKRDDDAEATETGAEPTATATAEGEGAEATATVTEPADDDGAEREDRDDDADTAS